MNTYLFLLIFFLVATIFALSGLIANWLLAPKKPGLAKNAPYECGIEPEQQAWTPVGVSYYLYALIFVIFDIETVFLLPALTVVQSLGWIAVVEIVLFVGILTAGLWYVWKKGALVWE